MPSYEILIPATKNFLWEFGPFMAMIKKFWPDHPQITVFGDVNPNLDGVNFIRHRLPLHPTGAWVDGFSNNVLELLHHDFRPDKVLILMSDYWLTKPVNAETLERVAAYLTTHDDVIRMQVSNGMSLGPYESTLLEEWGGIEIRNGEFLKGSLIPGMWSRKLILQNLPADLNMWRFETEMDRIIRGSSHIRSLSMLPHPFLFEHCARTRIRAVDLTPLPLELRDEIRSFIPADFRIVE